MKAEPVAPQITVDDFFKVDLRVCRVVKCEAVPKAKKLLRLELDDGMGGRQIVSSIHPWYEPEDLTGHNIIVIVNLKPAKFCGVESNGMLLAGETPPKGRSLKGRRFKYILKRIINSILLVV